MVSIAAVHCSILTEPMGYDHPTDHVGRAESHRITSEVGLRFHPVAEEPSFELTFETLIDGRLGFGLG
jgi:hypothetical protein